MLIRVGMWIAVVAASLWVGGKVIKEIEDYLPYAFIAGAVMMIVGFFLQQRKADKTSEPQQ